jgi:GTP-binding protein
MAFIDEVQIYAASGNGGNGVVRWLRTKETARGGPSGGDGGNGGDVFLEGVRDLTALAHYRYEKKFLAHNGEAGKNELKHGAVGKSVTLKIPIGTVVEVIGTNTSYEISQEGKRVLLFKGGSGGKGNARFKSSTNMNQANS